MEPLRQLSSGLRVHALTRLTIADGVRTSDRSTPSATQQEPLVTHNLDFRSTDSLPADERPVWEAKVPMPTTSSAQDMQHG